MRDGRVEVVSLSSLLPQAQASTQTQGLAAEQATQPQGQEPETRSLLITPLP